MNSNEQDTGEEVVYEYDEEVAGRIIHILSIYPVISPTMLQCGLGPVLKPAVWRPALKVLIDEGVILEVSRVKHTPAGRYNTYGLLHLAAFPYETVEDWIDSAGEDANP